MWHLRTSRPRYGPGGAGAAQVRDELADESPHASRGPRGAGAHQPLDQRRKAQTGHQRSRQDQARVGHQTLMINRRREPVQTAR